MFLRVLLKFLKTKTNTFENHLSNNSVSGHKEKLGEPHAGRGPQVEYSCSRQKPTNYEKANQWFINKKMLLNKSKTVKYFSLLKKVDINN